MNDNERAGRDRLYQDVARRLRADLAGGRYAPGERLPAERDLAAEFDVSRPTIREAIIALEVQGLVEVRLGSGTYVLRVPGAEMPGFAVSAFELTEARLLIEGETAAFAARHIDDEELDRLDALVARIGMGDDEAEEADRAFHLAIAQATRNAALVRTVDELWRLRAGSPESALLLAKARAAQVMPVMDEHAAVAAALRTRDPAKARAAMRAHLGAVLDHLLFATEAAAVEEARRAAASTRARYGAHHEL